MRYKTELDTTCRDFTHRVMRSGYSLELQTHQYVAVDAGETDVSFRTERTGLVFSPRGLRPRDSFETDADAVAWLRENQREYRPADFGDLHREFANCKSEPEAAVDFVNRFGLISPPLRHPFLEDFYSAQKLIRDLLQLARRTRASESKVAEVINRNRCHFFLRVTATPKGKLIQKLVPESLLGWMLLQAVRELTGSTWGECEVCGAAFEVVDERQSRQRFCSDRCRQKNFRDQGRR